MGHPTSSALALATLLAGGFAEPRAALTTTTPLLEQLTKRSQPAEVAPAPLPPEPPALGAPFVGPLHDPFPARSYGQMTGAACLKALEDRGIPFARTTRSIGVDTPVRLLGTLHGVDFHSEPDVHRERMSHEILDCRLALALDDLAATLAKHDIVEAIHLGMWVPHPPGKRPRHHAAALAIDLGALVKADGTRMNVQHDWHGRIGAKTCSESAPPWKPTEATLELRDVLCAAVEARTFHLVLTPNHDARHVDHFHLEVMRDTTWTMTE